MANKLKIYEIEYDGKIYELEAPDGTPEEELFGAIEGYNPEPASAPAPTAPAGNNSVEPVPQGSYETAEMGVDRWLRQEEAKPLSDEDAQTYLRMTKDPTIPATAISDWLSERGGVWTPQADQELADYRRAIQEGKEVSDFIGYEPLSNTLLDPYTPEVDPGVGGFGAALEEGMAYNPMGMIQRGIEDLFDVEQGGISKDRIRELYPNLSDDAVENVMDGLMGELRRRELANAGFQVEERDVNLPTRIAGNLIGGASPVDVVPLGRGLSVGRRVGEGFAANAALDAAMQAGDITYGAQDEFRPEQTLQAGAEGAALQGVFEGVAKLAGGVARRIEDRRQAAEAPVSEAPARINVPTARKNAKAYKEQIATTAGEVVDTINAITKDWQNAPEIEVHTNFKDVDGVANDAVGVFTPEGKVLINTEAVLKEAKTVRVSPEDVVSGVLFHESLGHYGLTQQFGDELDDMLDTFYSSGNSAFQSRVDQWLSDNPTAYKNNPNRTRLATEEVLAEWSEAGQLPASIGDRLINFVKKWAREMGIDLSFSEREIRAILGMAHNAVVNGKRRDVAANEFKLATKYHGSGADFDKFDHSKMGTGEGAQVFGWGTYLSDSKGIAESYRDKLGEEQFIYKGAETPRHVAREQYLREAEEAFPDNSYPAEAAFNILSEGLTGGREITGWDIAWYVDDSLQGAPKSDREYASAVYQPYADFANERIQLKNTGKLYEVAIPDDAKFLEWEVPIKDQPELIEAIEKLGYEVVPYTEWLALNRKAYEARRRYEDINEKLNEIQYRMDDDWDLSADLLEGEADALFLKLQEASIERSAAIEATKSKLHPELDGQDIYNLLEQDFPDAKAASLWLSEQGFTGNRYLANNIRGNKARTSKDDKFNYVIFDDNTPKITNKYMRPTKIRDVNVSAADRASLSDAEVNTIADAQYLINRLTEGYEPQQRRSWAESKEEARALGLDNATVKRIQKKGVDQFDTRLFQYDAITNRLTEELAELLPKMNARDMTLARKEKFMTLLTNAQLMYARVLDETSEVARALNAVKAIQNSKRNLDNLNRVLSEYQDGSGNMLGAFADDEVTMKFATQLQQMLNDGNPAGAALAVRQILKPYWWQYVLSFRHAMMLSGLATHAKNTADNAMMITRNLEEKIMALPGQAVRAGLAKAGKATKDGVSVEEVAAHSYGLLRALMDSSTYKNAAKSFREGHGSTPYSAKIEMQDAHIPYVGKVNDFLYAQDTFFRAFHQNASLYSLGVRKARQEGFTGRRAFEEGAAKAHNPTPEMIKEADQLSDEALLVDTPSLFSSKLESLKAIRPNMTGAEQTGAFVANMLFPFFRVTDRLLFQALRRAGPLAYLDKNTRADLEAGGARRDIAIARATFGGALIWYYWNEAGGEELEGAGDPDYRKRQALEAGGWRPNSVKEDDRYVDATALNLSFLPWDTQNAVAANVASIREAYDRGEDVSEQLGLAAQALMNVLASQSYGENLASYFGPIADTNPDTAGPSWANFVGGQASAFVPAAVRQMNQQVVDPVKRDTSGDKSFGDRVAGRIMSGIPGLSDNLPARRDVYGDVVPQGRTTFGMNNYTEIKDDLVSTELTKLEKSTDKTVVVGAPSSFQMESAPDVTTRYGTAKEGKVKLSAEGKQEWQRALGEFLREDMMEWVTSEDWVQMSNEEKIEVVKEVRKAANADAKAYMLELLELTEEE